MNWGNVSFGGTRGSWYTRFIRKNENKGEKGGLYSIYNIIYYLYYNINNR